MKCKKMSQKILFLQLLLLHYATQSQPKMYANCYENYPVMCPVADIESLDFISVAWYKLENHNKFGIIRRGKVNMTTLYYNYTRSSQPIFGEKHSLLLRSVTPEDSGTYECEISADVGGQNKNLEVHLTVHACVPQTDQTSTITVLNGTHHDLFCHKQGEDLPVMWSIIGYVAVGFAKVILSLISIWVIQALRMRSSRRWQHKW